MLETTAIIRCCVSLQFISEHIRNILIHTYIQTYIHTYIHTCKLPIVSAPFWPPPPPVQFLPVIGPSTCKKKIAYYKPLRISALAGTSGRASPEKWKDEDLGWFPDPKGKYTEFSNSILSKFYLSFWTTCPYEECFRRCFVTERNCQWEVCEALKAINHHKLAFATSDNPAAPGRCMDEQFCEKDETNSALLPTRRPYIPTIASYQIFILSLGLKPPPLTVSQTTSSLQQRLSDCLKEVY